MYRCKYVYSVLCHVCMVYAIYTYIHMYIHTYMHIAYFIRIHACTYKNCVFLDRRTYKYMSIFKEPAYRCVSFLIWHVVVPCYTNRFRFYCLLPKLIMLLQSLTPSMDGSTSVRQTV